MKEIHKIYLVCLVILILFFIIYFSKEHFKNLFEQQTTKLLQVSPQENELENFTEGLYVIECIHFKEGNKKIYLNIDENIGSSQKLPFSFTNSENLEPNDIIDKNIIKERGSNLRLENGIFIDSENDTFKFRKIYYSKHKDFSCQHPINDSFCKGKEYKNFKIIQYYDNISPHNKEIRYFIKHNNKFLYVDYIHNSKNQYEIKELEMNDICKYEGYNYQYLFNNKDNKDYDNNYLDKDYPNDKEFNRTFNDIPKKDMCPSRFPYACSDEINWRNKCSKEKATENGKCPDAPTITTKENKSMRNFNCHGFKCYNTTKQIFKEDKFLKKDIINKKNLLEKYNKDDTLKALKRKEIIDMDKEVKEAIKKAELEVLKTENESNWSPNEDYCKSPKDRFAGKDITQFLFNINAFKCEVKKGYTDIGELSFCHSHPQLERVNSKNIPFYDNIDIVRKGEKYNKKDNNSIKLENIENIKLDHNNLYDLYALNSKNKEGITEFKTVEHDKSCNDIDKNSFPNKWKEAENKSKIVGCFGKNDYFNFENEPYDNVSSLEDCEKKSKMKYYGYQSTTGKCFQSDNIPFLPKYNNFCDCAKSDEKINGYCEGNITGFSAENVDKIAIYKKTDEDIKKIANIQNNRVYHNFSYKIYNKKMYQYNYDEDTEKEYLIAGEYSDNDINPELKDDNYNRFIKIIRSNNNKSLEPIKYGEKIKLRFIIDKKEKGLKINPIRGDERILISTNTNSNSYLVNSKDTGKETVKFLKHRGNIRRGQDIDKIYNAKLTKGGRTSDNNTFLLLNATDDKENEKDGFINHSSDGHPYPEKRYKDWGMKNEDSYLRGKKIDNEWFDIHLSIKSRTDVGKHTDFINEEMEEKTVYYRMAKFPKSILPDENKKYYFNRKIFILSSLTVFDNSPNYGVKDYRSVYDNFVRFFLPDDKKISIANELLHWDHDNGSFSFKGIEIDNTLQKKNPMGKEGLLLPSKINTINTKDNGKIYFEKEIGNYPFIIQDIVGLGDEELEFEIINFESFNDGGYIDTKKPILLHNITYDIYFSINEYDQSYNSFQDKTNFNFNKDSCKLNMVMAKIDDYIPQNLKKVCYKTTPFQSIDLNKINMKTNCEPKEIRMNENKLNFHHGNYSFCVNQEATSQDLNNSFSPATYTDSNPYKPYHIPNNP